MEGSRGEDAEDLERVLMGGEPEISLAELAEATGLRPEVANLFWHALGFPDDDPPGRLFSTKDQEALLRVVRMVTAAEADEEFAVGLIRAAGHQMSRLAMWQVIALVEHMTERTGSGEKGAAQAVAFFAEHADEVESLLTYAWRRHLAAVIRWRLGRVGEDAVRMRLSVGFGDLVGYTRISQQLDPIELARLVYRFESNCSDVILRQGGRMIKTVGDEVLYVADTPGAAVDIGLDLGEAVGADPLLPEVRVGVATGEVVARMGDVYGRTVNLASRLTKLANPGRVLIEGVTAAALAEDTNIEAATLGEAVLPDFGTVAMFGVRRL